MLPLVGLLFLAACGGETTTPSAGAPPWDGPVDGAVAVTDWEDQGQPTSPFGPDGFGWGSPEELIAAMTQALATGEGIRSTGQVVERRESGTAIGWVRIELAEAVDDATIAADMRVEMRNDGGSWGVVRTEMRRYCAHPLVGGECP